MLKAVLETSRRVKAVPETRAQLKAVLETGGELKTESCVGNFSLVEGVNLYMKIESSSVNHFAAPGNQQKISC